MAWITIVTVKSTKTVVLAKMAPNALATQATQRPATPGFVEMVSNDVSAESGRRLAMVRSNPALKSATTAKMKTAMDKSMKVVTYPPVKMGMFALARRSADLDVKPAKAVDGGLALEMAQP